jgi:hypothetical protein
MRIHDGGPSSKAGLPAQFGGPIKPETQFMQCQLPSFDNKQRQYSADERLICIARMDNQ